MSAKPAAALARLDAWRGRVNTWRRGFDARAPRERALLGAAVLAALFLLADALWLGPALRDWRAARTELGQAEAQRAGALADAARVQAQQLAQAQALRTELAAWRQRVREADAALRERGSALVGPDRMVPLLEQLLAGHGRVRVRAMHSLPRADLLELPATPGAHGTATLPSLYRHGVELTLEGSFADLLAWLRALEASPQRLLWGSLQFKVEQHPRCVLTLRVHTLSLDSHWLEI
jgi:MSHA biogenesis protein MshJ